MENQQTRINKFLYGVIGLLILVLGFTLVTYLISTYPYRSGRAEAIKAAEKYANIEEVTDFDLFTRDTTYYTVYGRTKNDESLIVVVPKKGKQILTYETKEGINPEKAISLSGFSGEHISVNFGVVNDTPVWEVKQVLDQQVKYALVGFKDGKVEEG
ncbi:MULTISPECIES: DUF5590 domain-containing protein [unclassified Enterococcus]|uniref:cell wall elongation regulator TseB-like domain-containing protein n=1 Tax=unclassified Enterococcus TaxID=2608891 RepID=UPI00155242AA|nr:MULTISPECIES: DUF5590 domain-containing protein [unclassified Enterococcus]MBS7577170.1 DUF5590 domain-containing protein [Enterococcus sp. MMGLQ5-2]MBS7584737.1 DUF5590 domain-containing protein [Enterococcus sp. MMGLQ5-1]NPD12592.1 DUF5590 domain-containing protein [Enterococcus sp. MMGLQ5-1]NPD37004.1 DUF5590 domain-containing protein [Enterococcus sp. MMGLQ5-2]